MRHAHIGRHNSTLKNAAHKPVGCATRRRYLCFTAHLTVVGATPKDLATRRWLTPLATMSMTAASCSSDNRRGAPVSCRPTSPSPNPPWCGGEWTPRRGNRPGYSPRMTPSNRGRHPGTGPKTIHYRPGWESSPRAVADRGCCPWCPASAAQAVDGHHNQGVALSQPGVQGVPAPPTVGTGGPGDADILIDARKCLAGSQQLLALGFRVAARQLGDFGATGADVAVGLGNRSPSNRCGLHYAFVTHA